MASKTAGKVIHCRAAVAWEVKQPLAIETVEVAPPKSGEVRIKVLFSGVCHTDAHVLNGHMQMFPLPAILGHEGSGIVESIGEDVTEFEPGDHVIPLCVPQCRECPSCLNPKTNACEKISVFDQSLMPDKTSRFSCKGQQIFHFTCSTFSEYTVVPAIALCKIDAAAPLEKVCLIGCGVSTGYGAVLNTAKVEPGSTCAVWGLGGIGLAAVMGCHNAGAARIIGIDTNPGKFEIAKTFGATEWLNPKDFDKPIQQVLFDMTNGGPAFTFECVGNVDTIRAALESCHKSWGVSVVIGMAPDGQEIATLPIQLVTGRTWKGSMFGGWKSKESVPKLVAEYMSKKIKLDEFITHTMDLDRINEAFDLMYSGQSIRSVVTISKN